MKVLMFGWEFPPHISGGLGTACLGLTKGLHAINNVEIIFVVPKVYGDENTGVAEIIGANQYQNLPIKTTILNKTETSTTVAYHATESILNTTSEIPKKFTQINLASILIPYLSPEQLEIVLEQNHISGSDIYFTPEGIPVYLQNDNEVELKISYKDIEQASDTETFEFTGKYGPLLSTEVIKFAEVARKIASVYEFDIIHAHDWLTYIAGIEAKNISGKPLVIHVHATEFDRSGEHVNQFVYDIEKYGMDNADKIITVSNLTRDIVINRYGISQQKVHTVYNAVEFKPAHKIFKKTLNSKIVTFLGRITFQKGPEYFIEAAAKVLQSYNNVVFVMAGSGDLFRKMILRVAQLGISDKFYFTDFLQGTDVNHMFAISDVYVMPSVSEPFGISPLEAMRSNVPTIISKQSGVSEILKHAIKVDFWDVNAMADAIYALLTYDILAKTFSEKGKIEVENLKWEQAALQVKSVYDMIITS